MATATLAPRTTRTAPTRVLGTPTDSKGVGLTGLPALEAAGLTGWNIRTAPFGVLDEVTGQPVSSTPADLVAILRTDPRTGDPQIIGSATRRWTPIQIEDSFGGLIETFGAHGMTMEAGGSYGRVPGAGAFAAFIVPDGPHGYQRRVVLTIDNTGSGSFKATLHGTRVFCTNQLRGIFARSNNTFKLAHTAKAANVEAATQAARAALFGTTATIVNGIAAADAAFEADLRAMMATPHSLAAFEDEIVPVLLGRERPTEEGASLTRWFNDRDSIMEAYAVQGDDAADASLWKSYSAATEWLQWGRHSKGGEEGRASRNLFGTTAQETAVVERLLAHV